MIKNYIKKFHKANDEWLGIDKTMHFTISFAIGIGCILTITSNPAMAFAIAMVPGILKEFLDAKEGGSGFSYKDIVADALGVLVSLMPGLL